ncbi:MAG: RNA polymerase sigma factor [Bacteroidetes bacterium]|nr:RNA polymerase sigma factor [Bacteroidota bacterium]
MQAYLEITIPIEKDELVEKCKLGDRDSYKILYQKYAKAMFNTSLRMLNNRKDAEDILQDSFIAAFETLESFQYKSTFGAWMKKIVINKSINHLRKKKIDLIEIEKASMVELPQEEKLDENELTLKVETIKKAMMSLPNGYRTVLSLYLFEGYDHEEIAEILNVAHTTVRTQYMRAKQKLLMIIKNGG